jgi:hypothetical protein
MPAADILQEMRDRLPYLKKVAKVLSASKSRVRILSEKRRINDSAKYNMSELDEAFADTVEQAVVRTHELVASFGSPLKKAKVK